LVSAGIVDEVIDVADPPGGSVIAQRLARQLTELAAIEPDARVRARADRYGGRLRALIGDGRIGSSKPAQPW